MGYGLLFPGQGAQTVGMGRDLCRYSAARDVFDQADRALGFDLSATIFDGPEENLTLTAYTQPAILTVSVAVYRVLVDELGLDLRPDFVAGHSLGEYSALVVSGSLSLDDGVRLVHERGKLMQEAVPEGEGAMAAILGLSPSDVETLCSEVDGDRVCEAANFNSPSQVVISGHDDAVRRAMKLAKERGAKRALPLNVSAPFHCRLMTAVADKLAQSMELCSWSDSRWPLVANVSGTPQTAVSAIQDGLYRQTYSPVLWVQSMEYMASQGTTSFLELGPGAVLAGLSKKCIKGSRTLSVGTVEGLDDVAAFLEEAH
ncbi:MAG: [acyl-carrier-protein] S-malonyltransferase [Dethiosulfovibrio peptidovorans]|nr:MAG: [acyl-carrier-protein] S-malonyltransferase [Dethiosulfovibrio peptidovorans]